MTQGERRALLGRLVVSVFMVVVYTKHGDLRKPNIIANIVIEYRFYSYISYSCMQ